MEAGKIKGREEERPTGAATTERPIKSAKSADEERSETNGEERLKRGRREGGFARNRAPKAGEFNDGESGDGAGIRDGPVEGGVFKSLVETDFEVFVRRGRRRFEFETAKFVDEAHIARAVGVGAPTVVKARAHLERGRDRASG